ncbi:MAG: asparagine synthase (glutamine-hydrolyzing) [Terriglobia bacterium]
MCGIVAIFSQDAPIDDLSLERATASLRHRGPDGQFRWIASDRKAGLGHARLSIIDLLNGKQPIANEDESIRIVVNGEFYGYEEVQKALELSGHRLRTRSDSEIALHLYEDLGPGCLARLRGEFALVLWDSRSQTVFAARDRFGIKPLFYSWHERSLYLASEVKALFAAGVPARWQDESIYNSGGLARQPQDTLFDGVYQIPPGHYMVVRGGRCEVNRYWDFDYPVEDGTQPLRSDAEYAAEFLQTFDEAVKTRLRADVPVACYLSGGIDSCAVLGSAARHHAGPIRAFTLRFDRPEYDEGAVASEMATKAGAEFCPVPILDDDLADHFAGATLHAETLCVNAHGVAKYLLSRAVRQAGYKVVLTGEGSDEMLAGYLHFRRDLAPRNGTARAPAFPAAAPPSSLQAGSTPRRVSPIHEILGFVPGWLETASALSAKVRSVLADDYVRSLDGRDGIQNFLDELDVPGQLAGRNSLHQSLYLWAKTRLPNYILTVLGDRMEMAHSVEGRVPFLDHRLVELIRSQPVAQKIRGGSQKYVLRESLRNVITETVYKRHKHPFLTPPAMINARSRFSLLIQDTLRGPSLRSMPFFDQRKLIRLLDDLQTEDECSRAASDQLLMIATSACVLHEGFRLSA